MKTIKATSFKDEHNDIVVSHVFKLEDDGRRFTDFYVCGNDESAKRLVKILENNK